MVRRISALLVGDGWVVLIVTNEKRTFLQRILYCILLILKQKYNLCSATPVGAALDEQVLSHNSVEAARQTAKVQ